jgi:hypothetical protein
VLKDRGRIARKVLHDRVELDLPLTLSRKASSTKMQTMSTPKHYHGWPIDEMILMRQARITRNAR